MSEIKSLSEYFLINDISFIKIDDKLFRAYKKNMSKEIRYTTQVKNLSSNTLELIQSAVGLSDEYYLIKGDKVNFLRIENDIYIGIAKLDRYSKFAKIINDGADIMIFDEVDGEGNNVYEIMEIDIRAKYIIVLYKGTNYSYSFMFGNTQQGIINGFIENGYVKMSIADTN